MSTVETEYLLTVNISSARTQLRQIEALLMTNLSLLRRFSGNENLNDSIMMVQKMITTVRTLQIAITMLSSSTPFGILMGLAGLATTAFMAQDTLEYSRRGL